MEAGLEELTGLSVALTVQPRITSYNVCYTKLLRAGHPETGHVPVPREPDDGYPGRCPFHGACLEGMASGPAVAERWGAPAESLPPDHPAWDLEARYLASGFLPLVLALATERIVLGGGSYNFV